MGRFINNEGNSILDENLLSGGITEKINNDKSVMEPRLLRYNLLLM